MSQENVEIVRRFLHAFVQGDYEASTEHIGAEVALWSDPRANMETQQVRGRQAVTASIGRFISSFDDYWCAEPDELIDAGDWVVVVMRSGGRGRTSGVAVTQTWNVAYELAERKVVRIEFHPTRDDALEAAGLPEYAMSEENVKIVLDGYARFNAGERAAELWFFTPDAEYHVAREDPDSAVHRGIDAVRRQFARWVEAYPDLTVEPLESKESGDKVFLWVRFSGRGEGSGVPVEMELAHVLTMRDGRVVRTVEYYDRAEALEAAGLSE